MRRQWCIGQLTTLFLWRMENILHLYALPYDSKRPLICVDERPCQLLDDVLVPLPMESGKPKTFTGQQRAEITALACSEPPVGYDRWSLRLLARRLFELEMVESISHVTVQDVLKKTNSSLT